VSAALSVIVTTYDNPSALALVLAGLSRQTVRDFEVVIADDGSGPATRALIDATRPAVPFRLEHVWQPHEGFRKCRVLNRAIGAARGEYLIFFDGDCVPERDNLAVHLRAARPRRYLAGGAVMLSARASARFTAESVARGDLERFGRWWWETDKPRRLIGHRLPGIRYLCDRNVRRPPGWRGGNSSTYAEYVHLVNGFDERFGYGFEDADFGHRLEAAGIIGYSLRYTAPVYHFAHARPYVCADEVARNKALYEANRAARLTATPCGLRPLGLPAPA
jgi:glycosyltransferase involved in cell wall biosynthesis